MNIYHKREAIRGLTNSGPLILYPHLQLSLIHSRPITLLSSSSLLCSSNQTAMASSAISGSSMSCNISFCRQNIIASPFKTTTTRLFLPKLRHSRTIVRAQRATWLPGLDPPPYLDGKLTGDYGFDPLGLGEDPEALRWYVQAELVHCRFAMAGVAGILFTDLLRVSGIANLPVWYEAGAAKYNKADIGTLVIVQLLLMGFAETKRYMDYKSPGSQAKEGSFLGLEAALQGQRPGYPGGPLFNPLGLAKDIDSEHELKLKEIKNGRLAMIAMLGFFVQAAVTHAGPIDNLLTHISDPLHHTIIQTLSSSN